MSNFWFVVSLITVSRFHLCGKNLLFWIVKGYIMYASHDQEVAIIKLIFLPTFIHASAKLCDQFFDLSKLPNFDE